MENFLLTKCSQYTEAWRKLIPQMWEFSCRECPQLKNGPIEDIQEMDDGKLAQTKRMCLYLKFGVTFIKGNLCQKKQRWSQTFLNP